MFTWLMENRKASFLKTFFSLYIHENCQASVSRLQKFLEEIWFVIATSKLLSYPHFNPCWISPYYHRQLPAYKRHHTGDKEWSFPLRICSVKVIKSAGFANLITFTEKILIVKLHFSCSHIMEACPKRKGDQVCWERAKFEKCTAGKTKFWNLVKTYKCRLNLKCIFNTALNIIWNTNKIQLNTIEFSCPNFYTNFWSFFQVYVYTCNYILIHVLVHIVHIVHILIYLYLYIYFYLYIYIYIYYICISTSI